MKVPRRNQTGAGTAVDSGASTSEVVVWVVWTTFLSFQSHAPFWRWWSNNCKSQNRVEVPKCKRYQRNKIREVMTFGDKDGRLGADRHWPVDFRDTVRRKIFLIFSAKAGVCSLTAPEPYVALWPLFSGSLVEELLHVFHFKNISFFELYTPFHITKQSDQSNFIQLIYKHFRLLTTLPIILQKSIKQFGIVVYQSWTYFWVPQKTQPEFILKAH